MGIFFFLIVGTMLYCMAQRSSMYFQIKQAYDPRISDLKSGLGLYKINIPSNVKGHYIFKPLIPFHLKNNDHPKTNAALLSKFNRLTKLYVVSLCLFLAYVTTMFLYLNFS
tara:strand:- start:14896 stop:15228 length:333 start_codon:yes stop_codon:yes gene_type:complete